MGGQVFPDLGGDCILYLAVNQILLDDRQLEGAGVEPDVVVDYPLDRSVDRDPQFDRALEEMSGLLKRPAAGPRPTGPVLP